MQSVNPEMRFKNGDRVFYYLLTLTACCPKRSVAVLQDFDEQKYDEDFYNSQYYIQPLRSKLSGAVRYLKNSTFTNYESYFFS